MVTDMSYCTGSVLRRTTDASGRASWETKLWPNIALGRHPGPRVSLIPESTRILCRLICFGLNGRNGHGGGKAFRRSPQHCQNTGPADEKTPRMSPD